MSNRQTGEVSIEVEGQTFRLVLDMNALCELEAQLSTPTQPVTFNQALMKASIGSAFHIRAVLWAAMREHHPEMTVKDVGKWISKVGIDRLGSELTVLAESTMPDAADTKDLALKKRPKKAQRA